MQKITELGFEKAAIANLTHDASGHVAGIDIGIIAYANASNILYAFVFHNNETDIDLWHVRYIGHTRKNFGNRMAGYQAGHGFAVNNRVHMAVKGHLVSGGAVLVYVMSDRFLLSMHDLHVDVAAGLEYSLIAYYRDYNYRFGHPRLLNKAGNPVHGTTVIPAALASTSQEVIEEQADVAEEERIYIMPVTPPDGPQTVPVGPNMNAPLCQFDFALTPKVYWPLPVINVQRMCDQYFGKHGDIVRVDLVDPNGVVQVIDVKINRTANTNGTPRLWFEADAGVIYTNWKGLYRLEGNTVTVLVLGRNHIRLIA